MIDRHSVGGWAGFSLVEEEERGILGRKKREKRFGSRNRARSVN